MVVCVLLVLCVRGWCVLGGFVLGRDVFWVVVCFGWLCVLGCVRWVVCVGWWSMFSGAVCWVMVCVVCVAWWCVSGGGVC